MSCNCAEKVSLLIDGELPQAEVREVERHLVECAECRELHADFLGLRQQLSSYPSNVDYVTQQKALTAILGEQSSSVEPRPRWFGLQWNSGRTAIAFASLLLIALLIGIVTYRNVALKKTNELTAGNQPSDSKPGPSPVKETRSKETPPKQTEQVTPKEQEPRKSKPAEKRGFPRADSKDNIAVNRTAPVEAQVAAIDEGPVRAADAVTMTAIHFEKSERLLRAFRNVRLDEPGVRAEVDYEKKKAQQLVYQNMMLRREADSAGDVETASLLESLEPILIDIANLPNQPADEDVRIIKERVERKNIVALLQVNSAALARGLD